MKLPKLQGSTTTKEEGESATKTEGVSTTKGDDTNTQTSASMAAESQSDLDVGPSTSTSDKVDAVILNQVPILYCSQHIIGFFQKHCIKEFTLYYIYKNQIPHSSGIFHVRVPLQRGAGLIESQKLTAACLIIQVTKIVSL